jgi:hypothetical protein
MDAVFRELRNQALANPWARANDMVASDFMRAVGKGWTVGLSVNK